ncbi:adenosine receptor A2b-like [Oculina patagonica]
MEDLLNIFDWLLSVATVSGNAFVVFLVVKNRRLHSSANWFVLSLAVADFGVGIVVYPPSYFCNNSMLCNFRVYVAFFWFFLHSSVTNLCVLTWDRYVAIVHPLKYNSSITERRPWLLILAAWLLSFAISLTLFVGMYLTSSNTALKVLRITGVSGFDIISCALLLYAVVRILVVARRQSHQVSAIELQITSLDSRNERTELATSRRHRKHSTAPFVIALVVLFLGCYTVVNYLVLCIAFSCHKVSDKTAQVVTFLLVVNSAVNPLVYALLKKDIKREISKLICRGNNHRERSLIRRLKIPFPSFYRDVSDNMPFAYVVFFTYLMSKVH